MKSPVLKWALITKNQLSLISQKYNKSDYGQSISQYLKNI